MEVEIDFFDPQPDESGGLISVLQLLSTPIDEWFELTLSAWVTVFIVVEVGKLVQLVN